MLDGNDEKLIDHPIVNHFANEVARELPVCDCDDCDPCEYEAA